MNLHRVARAALVGPLMITGGVLVLTLGSANVLAASPTGASHSRPTANVPRSSSGPHEHENVECHPGKVAEKNGQCQVTFNEIKTNGEPNVGGQRVCFSVSPMDAGKVQTGNGNCAVTSKAGKAFGTFTTSGTYCGKAVITATETAENEQAHHTTITIVCKDASTTAFTTTGVPPGSPLGGWVLALLGVGAALAAAIALRIRFSPRRLALRQSA